MIWDRIPKLTYISFLELRLGVYDAIASFNIGKNTSIPIFQKQKLMISSRYYLKRERGGEGGGDTAHFALQSYKILLNTSNRA